ncbi:NUDIX domain-containing protein [Marivirga atlantica]|jgi:hypothetical protein|uniref:NUDIX domain-containing protein n=1 Tax=Marivirga atlantica TaxID=1548457 RepID=A0A937AMP0_9BACT|nr:NUDIX domain-containing protein [Marivirga atlantica]MBL0765507.1 NUDIX domain-containing protein [Marivirga atlantica]
MNDKIKSNIQYTNAAPILAAVDCIIFGVQENELQLLVFKREVEPLSGQWSLIGDFIKKDESVAVAARRVLEEVTGFNDIYMKQLHLFGELNRDPGDRVLSVAYWSLIRIDQVHQSFKARNHESKWVSFNKIPDLVLDHNEMVNMAIQTLREKARFHPIGFELLPAEFTIPQLLMVYEAIYNRKIDDRNFRKKILKSELLDRLEKKDKSTSKKGSFLYKFNNETYKKLQKEGYYFDF